MNAAVTAHGAPDLVVACAGLSHPGLFDEVELATFRSARRFLCSLFPTFARSSEMTLNYFGCLNLAKAVVPSMREKQRGRLVFVGSALSLTGIVGYGAYCPTKYAVRGLADVLRHELLRFGERTARRACLIVALVAIVAIVALVALASDPSIAGIDVSVYYPSNILSPGFEQVALFVSRCLRCLFVCSFALLDSLV